VTLEGLPPTPPRPLLQDPVYGRQPREPHKAYAAFRAYRDMGPSTRSIDEACRLVTNQPAGQRAKSIWRTWAHRWSWRERVSAWDEHLDAEQRAVSEQAARDAALELAEQRRTQRKRELDLGIALLARAEEMLALPLVEVRRETDDGKQVTIIKPVAWRHADLGAIARIGVELTRLGLDMETARTAVTVDIEADVRELARRNGWDEDAAVASALRWAHEHGERAG
jgi:hypothetical protein